MLNSSISKNLIRLAIFILFALPVFSSFAAQVTPKDVVEFYLALPKKYYEPDRKHRQGLIAEDSGRIIAKDIKNGYLAISGDAGDPGVVVAIFKKADGQYIVGLNVYNELSEHFYFLQHGVVWRDVSKEIVPEYSTRLKYELPRYGTTVKVTNSAGKKLYDLEWKQGRFVKKTG
jgi:hypothetical protein